jgi:hypothetical protein
MADKKRACIVYVSATARLRATVRDKLEKEGYAVHEVKADLDDALAAQAGGVDLPPKLKDCIENSDLCVFLLPEAEENDGCIGAAADFASKLEKRLVGVVAGAREKFPASLDDHADAMVRDTSERIGEAINGKEVWEKPDRSLVTDRPIKHIRCQ